LAEVTAKATAKVTANSTAKAMAKGTAEAKIDQQGGGCNGDNNNSNQLTAVY
jgi:hypothetical protein